MAVTLITAPVTHAPAYKPVQWVFSSSLLPNTNPATSNLGILAGAVATQTQVDSFPGLNLGDFYIFLAIPAPDIFTQGQSVTLSGTTAGALDGTYTVTKYISDTIFVIGTDLTTGTFGGFATLNYSRLRLWADVQFDTESEPQRYYIDADPDGMFRLDIRNQAQRTFNDVFRIANPTQFIGVTDAHTYITNRYTLTVGEAYNTFSNGVATYYIETKAGVFISPKSNNLVVNSVQPYHHENEWDDTVDLNWDDNLVAYIVSNSTTGSRLAKLLTYFPAYDGSEATMQMVGSDDAHFLGFLSMTPGQVKIRWRYYNSAGAFISQTIGLQNYGDGSGLIRTGPAHWTGLLPANTAHYVVDMVRASDETPVSYPYAFKLDTTCYKAPRRLWALNKFGSIDAYTWTSEEARMNGYERETITKPTMPAVVNTTNGDWQRRTWRVTPERMYSNVSAPLSKAMLRYVADEILESPDVRTIIHTPSIVGADYSRWWTRVTLTRTSDELGIEHGRLRIEYIYGIDNQVQTR